MHWYKAYSELINNHSFNIDDQLVRNHLCEAYSKPVSQHVLIDF